MPFGITPLAGFAQQAPTEFPRFLQFQNLGIDLGGPDAETLDFEGSLVATRGTGENSGKVTVTVAGLAGGTVTSVNMSVPAEFAIAGNPITGAGTLAVSKVVQNANEVWAGPASGLDAQPAFRTLVNADMPAAVANVAFNNQAKNLVYAGPPSGGVAPPSFRALVTADLPFAWNTPGPGNYTLVLADLGNGVVMNGGTLTIPPNSSVAFPDGASIVVLDKGYMDPYAIAGDVGVTLEHRVAFLPASAGQFGTVTLIQQGIDNWILCGDLEAV